MEAHRSPHISVKPLPLKEHTTAAEKNHPGNITLRHFDIRTLPNGWVIIIVGQCYTAPQCTERTNKHNTSQLQNVRRGNNEKLTLRNLWRAFTNRIPQYRATRFQA